jgi:hypothetical protein
MNRHGRIQAIYMLFPHPAGEESAGLADRLTGAGGKFFSAKAL